MSTLRERLVALARSQPLALTINRDEMVDVSWSTRESLALAAARLALEDATKACAAESFNVGTNGDLRDVFHDKACANCAAAVSSLRNGLD